MVHKILISKITEVRYTQHCLAILCEQNFHAGIVDLPGETDHSKSAELRKECTLPCNRCMYIRHLHDFIVRRVYPHISFARHSAPVLCNTQQRKRKPFKLSPVQAVDPFHFWLCNGNRVKDKQRTLLRKPNGSLYHILPVQQNDPRVALN